MADSNSTDWNQFINGAYGFGIAIASVLTFFGLKGQGPAFFTWWAGFINRKEVAKSELLKEAKTEAKEQASRVEELLIEQVNKMEANNKAQAEYFNSKFDEQESRHRESEQKNFYQFLDLSKQYAELRGENKAMAELQRRSLDADHANTLVAQATAALIKTNPDVLKTMDAAKETP